MDHAPSEISFLGDLGRCNVATHSDSDFRFSIVVFRGSLKAQVVLKWDEEVGESMKNHTVVTVDASCKRCRRSNACPESINSAAN